MSKVSNIQYIFNNLPKFGWGDAKEFTNSLEDIEFIHKILSSHATIELIIYRTTFLSSGGNITFPDWCEMRKNDDCYSSHCLKQYAFANNNFEIPKSLETLDNLSKIFLHYFDKTQL